MGKQIIKVSPDEDLYLEWSSVVEAPTFIGDRAAMVEHLMYGFQPETRRYDFELGEVEVRLQRTDETGSSGWEPFGCSWDDSGEIYMQQGFLPRAKMRDLALLYLAATGPSVDASGLLEPFEDAR